MKDVSQIFDENLLLMCETLGKYNFSGCKTISTDLLRISALADYKDGVLIGEVLEAVFGEIGNTFELYEIREKDRDTLAEEITGQINLLTTSNKANEKNIYEILRNIRYTTTKFQIMCFQTRKMKRSTERGLGRGFDRW